MQQRKKRKNRQLFSCVVSALCLTALFVLVCAVHFRSGAEGEDHWTVSTQRQQAARVIREEGADSRPVSLLPGERIDLNNAPAKDLERLPGIGAQRAVGIVRWRETHGGFSAPEELLEIPGIGEKTFARIKDYVTAEQEK